MTTLCPALRAMVTFELHAAIRPLEYCSRYHSKYKKSVAQSLQYLCTKARESVTAERKYVVDYFMLLSAPVLVQSFQDLLITRLLSCDVFENM